MWSHSEPLGQINKIIKHYILDFIYLAKGFRMRPKVRSTLTIAFICDVAYAERRVNDCRSWAYELRRSKIGSTKEIVGECKYLKMASENHKYDNEKYPQKGSLICIHAAVLLFSNVNKC